MKFFTEVNIEKLPKLIEHNHSGKIGSAILTIGSCFAENIGEKFLMYKFNALVNPFGVLYNSASIKNSIQIAASEKKFTKDDLVFNQDEWHSFYHHSNFSYHELEKVIDKINAATKKVNKFLKNVDWIIISLGTSFVYVHKEKKIIVSNCHKISQREFDKKFLTIEQNVENISEMIRIIRKENPNVKFIFTVSPIRHWKDGAHKNQLSKSTLHLAVNEIVENNESSFYFPSYEILIDELRDYRFYARDLLHPNDEAVDYIWEKFRDNCFSNDCINLLSEIEKIINASQHRLRNPHSIRTKKFAAENITKINKLKEKYPYLNFEDELKKFYSYLEK